jgi:hypothetical protein
MSFSFYLLVAAGNGLRVKGRGHLVEAALVDLPHQSAPSRASDSMSRASELA